MVTLTKEKLAVAAMETILNACISEMDMEEYDGLVSAVVSEYACRDAMIAAGEKFKNINIKLVK
jgi:hypothetical protein